MKSVEFKKLKEKSSKELSEMVKSKKLELAKVLGKISVGKERNLRKGMMIRREIAQIITVKKGKAE